MVAAEGVDVGRCADVAATAAPAAVLTHIQAAIAKGNLTKPHQAHLSLAYTAYSLKKYDLALEAALKASEYPEGAKDGQSMVNALKGIIADREAKKNKS